MENFSDDGSLLYGEALGNIGVPKCTDLTEVWLLFRNLEDRIGVELNWDIVSLGIDMSNLLFNSLLSDRWNCEPDPIESLSAFEHSWEIEEQFDWAVTAILENAANVLFKSFLSDVEPELDCELLSSSSMSNFFFVLSKSDRDGEFAVKIISSWKEMQSVSWDTWEKYHRSVLIF